ncbi:DNA-binding transcriptional regulator, MarR family [Daejeonella lutea]|uniref:DNA-binding transcriptional regulator, MarR family n=2 Tax=Daejeonella lutea TaxID=572036 RepID=A0A1T5F530_9SPHI|nr:DNA-binding transcriptional regulator, MarR family [Daejeonella lutea]
MRNGSRFLKMFQISFICIYIFSFISMNLINDLGELAIATRLKRLSERLSQDVSKIYKESDVDFEAKWYLVLELLNREKILAITEISESLELSHPAVVQFVDQLVDRKLVKTSTDKKDARKRMISLSPGGKKILSQLQPILDVIKDENRKWIAEADVNILGILDQLESALDKKSMYQRVKICLLEQPQSKKSKG